LPNIRNPHQHRMRRHSVVTGTQNQVSEKSSEHFEAVCWVQVEADATCIAEV